MIAIGIMSGTSADGIDAAAAELSEAEPPSVTILAHRHAAYPRVLRERVLAASGWSPSDAAALARLHGELGDAYADAAAALIAELGRRPDVIAVHGQTVAHLPREAVTLQLGDAARVAVRTGVPVVSDLRSADVAAGGEGAPLVPFADHVLFGSRAPIALLNLGGIANLTLIATPRADDVIAFDTGPANAVSDALARLAGAAYDEGGARAARGSVRGDALERALAHPYFARPAPKSTGREDFGDAFARDLLAACGGNADDAAATAVALTARTIADALARETPPRVRWRELVVAGGGARNPALMRALAQAVSPLRARPMDELGVPSEAREAVAFAILGAYRLRGKANTLPRCTGASRAVSAGALHVP